MPVSFQTLEEALIIVDFNGGGVNEAYVCRRTGEIFWQSPEIDVGEELPDDIEDLEKYLPIPNGRELGLGKPLALDFASTFLPRDYDDVCDMFSRRGAYARFEALLRRRGLMDRWYKFRDDATKSALREWCSANGLDVVA